MTVYLILCVFLAVLFGGGYYAYRICFFSPEKNRDHIPEIKGHQYDPYREEMRRLFKQLADRPCETVSVVSREGLQLSGRYYHIKDGAPLAICFHGYRSSPLTDFSGGSEFCFQLEQNVLLVDQRAHGSSQGKTIGFGITEQHDVLTWIRYALTRFGPDLKILLYGISMGGATVLMASSLPLPFNVKGIVADCPYSSPKDIILSVGKKLGYPSKLIWPFVIFGAKVFGGFDIRQTTAEKAVRSAQIPILIIHGQDDTFVPCDMSRGIADANPDLVQRSIIPGADHGISYLVDTKAYKAIVSDFMDRII